EVQQCMKLTVTNSSIDFFVPIDYVHQAKLDEDLFCLHGPKALQTARHQEYFAKAKTRDWRRTIVLYGWQARTLSKALYGQVTE
ncbi:hypothetical protein JZX86_28785, partial [Agrobacterium rosae]|uniref:hypothetical protein n=1 Tax=Agrobacterium rosae TaxID=1972867 RepID=UPI0019D3B65B